MMGTLNSMAEIGADPVTVREQHAAKPDRVLAELGHVLALGNVKVLDRGPYGQAGDFGDLRSWGLGHGIPPALCGERNSLRES
jgi:hypothetical protein